MCCLVLFYDTVAVNWCEIDVREPWQTWKHVIDKRKKNKNSPQLFHFLRSSGSGTWPSHTEQPLPVAHCGRNSPGEVGLGAGCFSRGLWGSPHPSGSCAPTFLLPGSYRASPVLNVYSKSHSYNCYPSRHMRMLVRCVFTLWDTVFSVSVVGAVNWWLLPVFPCWSVQCCCRSWVCTVPDRPAPAANAFETRPEHADRPGVCESSSRLYSREEFAGLWGVSEVTF